MHGFKSFAKHTELPFNSSFNCVLGPNGSGKSNVLDALCFVLGKSSSKSLRAERAANLIYNGGKSKNPAKQGEVSIYFDNSSKRFPTEDPEVKITRIVRQSGQSVYKINDKVRTRQQILDLLSIARIDPDGYNIILQGDIVRFVEMHPEERRQLVEEISGITIYVEKKDKALRELEKVGGRLKEADIILKERDTYLKELKSDRDQAMKFKEMDARITQNKASLLKLQLNAKEKERDALQQQLDTTHRELQQVQDRISEFRQQNEARKKEIEDITREIEQKGETEQVKLNKDIESLKIELTKYQSRAETCQNEIQKIHQRKQDLKNALKDIDQRIAAIQKERADLEKDKEVQQKEKEKLFQKVEQFKKKNKIDNVVDIEKSVEELDKSAEELQKGINELREEQHNLIREKDRLQHQSDSFDERIKKVKEVEKEYYAQTEALKEKRDTFKKATLELNTRLDEDASLAHQLGNARTTLQHAREELAKLQARTISIREFTAGDRAIKRILEMKNERSDIHGTVSELGDVQKKYATALEMAAGQRLKSIVVENDKTASDLIKYLKQNKLGVATFLPLNKIKAPGVDESVKKLADANGCHGMAIDLIEFDPKYKKIFSYVFANTLVVDNIDVARRLGIGKARMATLDGDLASVSGVMQGGFRESKKHSLGFKEKEATKELEEHEATLSKTESVIGTLENRRKENEEKIAELRNQKASLEGEVIKIEKSLHLESGDIELDRKKKDSLLKEIEQMDGRISVTSEKITELNRQLAKNKDERQKLKSKIAELRDPILLAELTTFEEKIRELDGSIMAIEGEMKNRTIQINTILAPEKEKTLQILKQIDKEELGFLKKKSDLEHTVKERNALLTEKEAAIQVFYTRFKSLFGKRNQLNEVIQQNERVIDEHLDKSRNVEIRGNTHSLKMAELRAVMAGMEQEFTQYEGVPLDLEKPENQLRNEIAKFEKLRSEIGSINMRALEIYEDVEKEYNNLQGKKQTLIKEKDDVVAMINEIEGKKKDLFMRSYEAVQKNFSDIFQQLTAKGAAHLELENPENPFEGGLFVKVKLAGNKFMDIRSLSGGEKTLTALAFIFSIQEHEPASFYVLDEVDAALDKHNSEKLAKLIAKYSEKAQYIIISHNDGLINEASNLYGVSMNEHGMSQVVSLKV